MSPASVEIEVFHCPIGGPDKHELAWDFTEIDPEDARWKIIHDRLDLMAAEVTNPRERVIPEGVPELLARTMALLASHHEEPVPQYGGGPTEGGAWEVNHLVNNWWVTVWYWPEGYDDA